MKVGEPMNNNNFLQPVGCGSLECTLVQSTDVLHPCDLLTCSVIVTNNDPTVSSCVLRDPLPEPIVFVPGTVFVNGINQPLLNPLEGIPIAFPVLGNSVSVTFICKCYGDSCCNVRVTTCDCCRRFCLACNRCVCTFRSCGDLTNTFSNTVACNVEIP